MKMMQGALVFACSKRSRTRAAPTPTNISTNSEPLIEKNGVPASPAMARASSVFPVPGGPDQEDALRDLAAETLVALGVAEEVDDLLQLRLRLLDAGDVGEAHLDVLLAVDARAVLAERQRRARTAAHDPARHEAPEQPS